MALRTRSVLSLLLALAFLASACGGSSSDDAGDTDDVVGQSVNRELPGEDILTVFLSAQNVSCDTGTCYSAIANTPSGSPVEIAVGSIDGFEQQDGHSYELRIRPTGGDGKSFSQTFELVETVSDNG